MSVEILTGDCLEVLKTLPDSSVNCCVTSPPYWRLRDYGVSGQLGLEETPGEYVEKMVNVFREVRRVLRADGTLWLNLGDSYAANHGGAPGDTIGSDGYRRNNRRERRSSGIPTGLKPKDLVGIPWRVAFALQADGWYLRSDIIWSKPNPIPESVTDRPTKAHEYLFLLSKSERYYYDYESIREDAVADHPPGNYSHRGAELYRNGDERHRTKAGLVAYSKKWKKQGLAGHSGNYGADGALIGSPGKRNRRSVWTVASQPFDGAHFATFPAALIEPCVLAGCPMGGVVLDPFGGSGTTGEVAEKLGRNSILIELNPKYVEMARERTAQMGLLCDVSNPREEKTA